MTMTANYPTTAPEATQQGYLVARDNYNGKIEQGRYRQHCERQGLPVIRVTPRRDYAALTVTLPSSENEDIELSPAVAILALRTARQYETPGRVRLDSIALEKLPINAAIALAHDIATMITPLPAEIVL